MFCVSHEKFDTGILGTVTKPPGIFSRNTSSEVFLASRPVWAAWCFASPTSSATFSALSCSAEVRCRSRSWVVRLVLFWRSIWSRF